MWHIVSGLLGFVYIQKLSSPPTNSIPEWPSPAAAPQITAPRPEDPPFSGWDVLRIALMMVVTLAVFSVGVVVVAHRLGMLRRTSPDEISHNVLLILPAQFLAYVVVFGFMYLLITRERRAPFWTAIRWNWPQSGWLGFAAVGVILAIAGQLISALLPIPKQLPIDQFFRTARDAYVMSLFSVTVAPFMEELLFRGLLYPVLARRLGVLWGVILTALPFALLHALQLAKSWGPLLVLFIVGLALTAVRAVTKSVAASMLVHIGYNLTLSVMLYIASDHFRHLERLAR